MPNSPPLPFTISKAAFSLFLISSLSTKASYAVIQVNGIAAASTKLRDLGFLATLPA